MKIFQLFASLSKEELKSLRKAVNSPLLTTNKKVVRLFEILRPLHPNFDDSIAARKKIFKKLFPKEIYHDYKLRWHFTELTKVIEQLLLHLAQESNDFERHKRLIEVYQQRGLPTYFFKGTDKLLEQIEQDVPNAEISLERFHLLNAKYFHPLHNKVDQTDRTLEEVSKNLDSFYTIQKLRLAIGLAANRQVVRKKATLQFVEKIKLAHENGFQKENKLLKLYLHALALFEQPETVNFEQFEQEVLTVLLNYPKIDQQFIYESGISFLLKQLNTGVATFYNTILQWYKFGLEHKILIVNGKIQESVFANIIINSCREKEFLWAEQFITNYHQYLPSKNENSNLSYFWGLFYYCKRDWDKAVDLLTNIEHTDIYPPRTKMIIVRASFENFLLDDSYFSLLLAHLQSFESYVRRDTHYASTKRIYFLSFIKIARQLAKKIHRKDSSTKIKSWFNEQSLIDFPLSAKNWLREKVSNLK